MKTIANISDVRTYRKDNQKEICYHGTKCDLIENKEVKYIRKIFVCDDHYFKANYRFRNELILNQKFAALNIAVPEIKEYNKKDRSIIYKYYNRISVTRDYIKTAKKRHEILEKIVEYTNKIMTSDRALMKDLIKFGPTEIARYEKSLREMLKKINFPDYIEYSKLWANEVKSNLAKSKFLIGDFDGIIGNSFIFNKNLYLHDFEWYMYYPAGIFYAKINSELLIPNISDFLGFKLNQIYYLYFFHYFIQTQIYDLKLDQKFLYNEAIKNIQNKRFINLLQSI